MNMENKDWIYAPILIPTCNRIIHLKECIESLNDNHNAERTEIYISVDYPAKPSFRDGNAAIIEFLKEYKRKCKFKKINVYIQNKNLGPSDNYSFLVERIKEKYDYYIFTEDDNIFSNSFIDFCNFGLQKYKDDGEIFFICGYEDQTASDKQWIEKTVVHSYYEPYGTACWIDKNKNFSQWLTMENLMKNALNFREMMKLRKYNRAVFNLFVMGVLVNPHQPYVDRNGNPQGIDILKSFYLFMNRKFALFPSLNLVHNHGNDGSGINTTKDTIQTRMIQGENIEYDFDEQPYVDTGSREDRCVKRKLNFIRKQRATLEYMKWYLTNFVH